MALSPSQTNLILQIAILAILLFSYALKQKRKLAYHGITMFIAVILNIVSFFWVMWPSFLGFDIFVLDYPIKTVALIHGVLGFIALILGVFLVAAWGLQKSIKYCAKRKNAMRITLFLWLLSLVLGILLYAILYGLVTI